MRARLRAYYSALRMIKNGRSMVYVSKKLRIPYATINCWKYRKAKPTKNGRPEDNFGKLAKERKYSLSGLTGVERAYLVGAYLGDGNSYDGLDFQLVDEDFAIYLYKLMRKIVPSTKFSIFKRYGSIFYRVRISSRWLKRHLEHMTNNKKHLPLGLEREEIIALISAFFDSEGCVKYRNKDSKGNFLRSNCVMCLSNSDNGLLTKICGQLNKLGVKASVSFSHAYGNGGKAYTCSIYGKYNQKMFLPYIQIKRKREKIAYALTYGMHQKRHKKGGRT